MTDNLPVSYDAQFAKDAEKYAKQARTSAGVSFSTQGGILKLGDEPMPGNQVCAVIVDFISENAFFDGKFVASDPKPPVCFAFGRDNKSMFPHEAMQEDLTYFVPQHIDKDGDVAGCTGCPQSEWGTADTGRGKACKETVKLAIIPAGEYAKKGRDFELGLYDQPSEFADSEVVFLRVPVTSIKAWDKYVRYVKSQYGRPPYGVVTRIWLEPHSTNQFTVNFETLEALPDAMIPSVLPRHEEAVETIIQPYKAPTPDDRALPGTGGRGGGAVVRR